MSTILSKEQIYEQAKKRVEAKKGFYAHLTVYILVNAMLVLIWALASDGGHPWFLYPLGGWGIALLSHFMQVFAFEGRSNQTAIENEMEKISREQR